MASILEGQQGVSNEVAAEQNINLDEKENLKKEATEETC